MSIPLRFAAPPALLAAAALVAAGCGGSSSNQASGSTSRSGSTGASTMSSSQTAGYGAAVGSAPATAAAAGSTTITTAHGKLGTYLVGPNKRAVYLFMKDKRGSGKSTCSGACAAAWPPVITKGSPKAMGGVKASKLGTLKRSNGARQVMYNGWPLYFYAADKSGTTNGQDLNAFGGKWYVMSASGVKIGD